HTQTIIAAGVNNVTPLPCSAPRPILLSPHGEISSVFSRWVHPTASTRPAGSCRQPTEYKVQHTGLIGPAGTMTIAELDSVRQFGLGGPPSKAGLATLITW